MPSVQIKDVPEATHAVLHQRAAAAHQSLQEYLLSLLVEQASQPTLDDDEFGDRARAVLRGEALVAPHLIDLEILSVLRRELAAGRLVLRRATLALTDLRDLRLRRAPHAPFANRIWQLRDNVTPCDASYVAVAEALEVPLVTADGQLSRAPGIRCEVSLLR